jgi:predicted nucleotidyltransferase
MKKLDKVLEDIDIDERLPVLVERLGQTPGLVALLLYGSYGTDRQTPLSDVDLAVIFHEDEQPGPEERLRMTGLVMDALQVEDVSLTFLDRAPLPFQHEVLRTGRALLVRDDVALADFSEFVIHRYCDFVIDYRAMLADYDEGLRQAHGGG